MKVYFSLVNTESFAGQFKLKKRKDKFWRELQSIDVCRSGNIYVLCDFSITQEDITMRN